MDRGSILGGSAPGRGFQRWKAGGDRQVRILHFRGESQETRKRGIKGRRVKVRCFEEWLMTEVEVEGFWGAEGVLRGTIAPLEEG